jgi:hypothetical protein
MHLARLAALLVVLPLALGAPLHAAAQAPSARASDRPSPRIVLSPRIIAAFRRLAADPAATRSTRAPERGVVDRVRRELDGIGADSPYSQERASRTRHTDAPHDAPRFPPSSTAAVCGEACLGEARAVGELATVGDVGAAPDAVEVRRDRSEERLPGMAEGLGRFGRATPGVPTVGGALTGSQVQRVMRRHLGEVTACYAGALDHGQQLSGHVLVSFAVDAQGRVVAVSLPPQASGPFSECVTLALRRMSFPAAAGETRVAYPFFLVATQS